MKRFISLITAAAVLFLFLQSCGESEEQNSNDSTGEELSNDSGKENNVFTLVSADSAGDPYLHSLNTSDADGNTQYFNFEGEASEIQELVGKKVKIEYKENERNSCMDILSGGESLIGEWGGINQNGGSPKAEWKTITGTLTADEVSQGDTPGSFSVKGDSGEMNFEYFVTEEMKAQSGNEVTAYYLTDSVKTITSIEAVE